MTFPVGTTVLVTGASKGLGRSAAIALAEQGAQIVAVARDAELLKGLLSELPGEGHRSGALDVRDETAWSDLISGLEQVDGLVTAAGIYGPIGRIDQVAMSEIRETFDVNVFGSLLAVRACLSKLATAGGSVVLFAGGGSEPLPGYDSYVSSKAAIIRLAENLAAELADLRIRVNAIAPGFVVTDIHRSTLAAGPDVAGAEFYARTVKAIDEGGFPPEEAAALVAFLISARSAPVTGRFVSARWDRWREPAWLEEISAPNLLTMRRIDGELFAAAEASS